MDPADLLVLPLALTAGACIYGRSTGRDGMVYVSKPLATLLVMGAWALAAGGRTDGYALAVGAGLLFSLAGDIFLMLPGDRFLPGLAGFLLAHLFYISAFLREGGPGFTPAALLPVAGIAGGMAVLLLPRAGKLRLPVAVYTLVIVVMVWQAWERWLRLGTTPSLLAAAGAALFMVSDAALAMNRIHTAFPGAEALILGTYFPAQYLIARSVG